MVFVRKFVMILLLATFLFSVPCLSSYASTGIVLVLSGGGLRGVAHVGVMKVLMDNNIPIVGIVGTSAGSLMGGLASIGYAPDQIMEIIAAIDLSSSLWEHSGQIFAQTGSHYDINTPSGYWPRVTKTKTKTSVQNGPLGFLSATKLFEKFTDLASKVEVVDFMHLPIPYAAVATDIETGEKVVLRGGSLASAMRASMAIPGLFDPWKIGDRLLVDGGLVSNLPVLVAKEIFKGYPVVAVDVTDVPGRGGGVNSMIDVLDKSLTILTHQNVLDERKYADVLVTPDVHDFGIFDESKINVVFERGVNAANEKLDIIKSLIVEDIVHRKTIKTENILDIKNIPVKDVVVTGLPPKSSELIRRQYLSWIGKPVDTKAIIDASKEITKRVDILAADYHIENDDGLVVFLEIVPYPDSDWGISGYTTNVDPYRWVYVRGIVRDILSERDAFHGVFKLGEEWGFDLKYHTAPDPLSFWEFRYTFQHWGLDPINAKNRNWRRHGLGFSRSFKISDIELGLGYAYEYIDGTGESNNSSGPVFYASIDTLDVHSDPTKGSALTLSAWWADYDELLFRVEYFQPLKLSQVWRTYLRLGYAEGNLDRIGHAVYLGAAEELYSMAAMPIEAERMAWANIAFRRVISKSIFGSITGEVFAGVGYALDKDNNRIDIPWETGVSITVPNNIIDTKFAVFYTSDREWRFGFFVGNPIWDHYPIP
ncbi:MAG: patatin-like phospholipase family protein [Synergistaceae bacterium]|nr:patatin-like phospholipase family protein [Synergistaceae bacterium]